MKKVNNMAKVVSLIAIAMLLNSYAAKAQFATKSEKIKFGYVIRYTNDGWKTKREISYYTGVYSRMILTNRFSAEVYRMQFKSFADCENHNRQQLRAYQVENTDYRVHLIKNR
jgi:hypothetical protein